MCWRCVADSVPYVAGSAGFIRAYGVRLARRPLAGVGTDEAVDNSAAAETVETSDQAEEAATRAGALRDEA